jgi:hypothetical protein
MSYLSLYLKICQVVSIPGQEMNKRTHLPNERARYTVVPKNHINFSSDLTACHISSERHFRT